MRANGLIVLVFGLVGMIGVGSANAAVIFWEVAEMNQANQVDPPAVEAPAATGSASGTYDDVTGELSWNVQWSGLTEAANAAHFHGPADETMKAGVIQNIGSVSGLVSPSIGSATISSTDGDRLKDGLLYINIHTPNNNPSGEIRGQVKVVPEPGVAGLLGLGAMSLFGRGRRAIGM